MQILASEGVEVAADALFHVLALALQVRAWRAWAQVNGITLVQIGLGEVAERQGPVGEHLILDSL